MRQRGVCMYGAWVGDKHLIRKRVESKCASSTSGTIEILNLIKADTMLRPKATFYGFYVNESYKYIQSVYMCGTGNGCKAKWSRPHMSANFKICKACSAFSSTIPWHFHCFAVDEFSTTNLNLY